MITLIHGDNTVLSRAQLQKEIASRSTAGKRVTGVTAAEVSIASLTNLLQPTSLFGDPSVLVIERLFKMRSKNTLAAVLTVLTTQPEADILLWEDGNVSATNLKLLKDANPVVQAFKTSPIVFQLLDLFGSPTRRAELLKLLDAACKQDTPEFVFAMLASRVRQLIKVAEGETADIKPYSLTKLRAQMRFFTLESLLKLHAKLLEIDLSQKQSTSVLSLKQQLELLAMQPGS